MSRQDQAAATLRALAAEPQIDAKFDAENVHPVSDGNLPIEWRVLFSKCNGETGPLRQIEPSHSSRLMAKARADLSRVRNERK